MEDYLLADIYEIIHLYQFLTIRDIYITPFNTTHSLYLDNNFWEKRKGCKGKEREDIREITFVCIEETGREMKGYRSYPFKL